MNLNKMTTTVLDAHDAGVIELPEHVLEARAAIARLNAITLPTPVQPATVRQQVLQTLITKGKAAPDVSSIVAAKAAQVEHDEAATLLTDARRQAVETLVSVIASDAEQLMVDVVRPRFLEVVTELQEIAPLLDLQMSDSRALSSDTPTREAWMRLTDLAGRYAVLRGVQFLLSRFDADAGEFSLFTNAAEKCPGYKQRDFPWSRLTDPRSQLLMQIQLGLKFVMPTAQERARMWVDTYDNDPDARATVAFKQQMRQTAGLASTALAPGSRG